VINNAEGLVEMDYITIMGLVAAALTVIAFFPQLMKVWKTKSTKDISLGMFSIFCVAVFLWFVYGILSEDPPVTIANFLVFIQAFIILTFKVKYK
jgi:MtN3 and saliva related transmembrane protein